MLGNYDGNSYHLPRDRFSSRGRPVVLLCAAVQLHPGSGERQTSCFFFKAEIQHSGFRGYPASQLLWFQRAKKRLELEVGINGFQIAAVLMLCYGFSSGENMRQVDTSADETWASILK